MTQEKSDYVMAHARILLAQRCRREARHKCVFMAISTVLAIALIWTLYETVWKGAP